MNKNKMGMLAVLTSFFIAMADSSDNYLGAVSDFQGFQYPVVVKPASSELDDPNMILVDFVIDGGSPRSVFFDLGSRGFGAAVDTAFFEMTCAYHGIHDRSCADRVRGTIPFRIIVFLITHNIQVQATVLQRLSDRNAKAACAALGPFVSTPDNIFERCIEVATQAHLVALLAMAPHRVVLRVLMLKGARWGRGRLGATL